MRIDKIEFKNFRKFVDMNLTLPKKDEDITLLIAENGVGKTTFSNAITWCLYGVEPKIEGREGESYPVLNSKIIDNAKDGDNKSVSVVLKVSDGDTQLLFKREHVFKIHSVSSEYYIKNGFREEFVNEKISVEYISGNGKRIKYGDNDHFGYYVSSFIPKSIKEFFFFDSEKLDNYFLTNSNIEKQTEKLSHISSLTSMKKHIDVLISDYDDLIEKDHKSEKLYDEYLDIKKNYNNSKSDYNELKDDYESLYKEYMDLDAKLRNISSISVLQKQKDEVDNKKEDNKRQLILQQNSLNDLVITESPNIFAKKAIDNALKILDDYSLEGSEYIDKKYLKLSASIKKCLLCDQDLTEEELDIIYRKLNKLNDIPEEIQYLTEFKSIFNNILIENTKYLSKNEEFDGLIQILEDNINDFENQSCDLQNEIDRNINNKKDTDRRDELGELLPDKLRSVQDEESNMKSLKKQMDSKYNKYHAALSVEEKSKLINMKKNLLLDAKCTVEKTYADVMSDTRTSLEKSTYDCFDHILRKSELFDGIKLDDDYSIKLYDGDRVITASTSATEKQLLAFAFTLAVHSISNYNSPLVIDDPFNRATGDNRLNLAHMCGKVSENRQILLILTDKEYTDDVKSVLNKKGNANLHIFKESEDEKEICLE